MVIIHHNDLDGRASALVALRYFGLDKATCIEMNYEKTLDLNKIKEQELVYVLDFSFEHEDEWDQLLLKTNNVIWIDHHKSAIEKRQDLDKKLEGLRKIGTSGCELTWQWFHCYSEDTPRILELIGDYDVWAFKYGDTTKWFHAGAGLEETKNLNNPIWNKWFTEPTSIINTIETGKTILSYENKTNASQLRCLGWITDFEGYESAVCEGFKKGFPLFKSINKSYDIYITYNFNGELYTIGLTSETVDVSKICMKYGGGGHKGAGGFHCKELPFKFKRRLYNES